MRKLTLIIVSLIFIGSSTELHQFIRLPFLVQHYRHHRSEDPGMSLLGFLKDHYQGEQDNEQDSDDDAKLPLRAADPIMHLGHYVDHTIRIEMDKPAYTVIPYTPLTDPALPAGLAISIFQPPRAA